MALSEVTLTPPEIAKELRVSPDKIRAWIERGELPAFNVANRVGGRPRWRVAREALAEFERRRTAIPRAAVQKSRKPEVIEFF
jgi:excisionase family DNA binding protein